MMLWIAVEGAGTNSSLHDSPLRRDRGTDHGTEHGES